MAAFDEQELGQLGRALWEMQQDGPEVHDVHNLLHVRYELRAGFLGPRCGSPCKRTLKLHLYRKERRVRVGGHIDQSASERVAPQNEHADDVRHRWLLSQQLKCPFREAAGGHSPLRRASAATPSAAPRRIV